MADLVIDCQERDLAFSFELTLDLALQRPLVGLLLRRSFRPDGQEEVDAPQCLESCPLNQIDHLGAEVLNRFGVRTDLELNAGRVIGPSQIVERMRDGRLDAAEWIGPHDDEALGLHDLRDKGFIYYYSPGWWEPSTTTELMVDKKAFANLPPEHQAALETACADTYARILRSYDLKNISALERLKRQGVQLRRFPPEMMATFEQASTAHLEELARQSPLTFCYVYREWKSFRKRLRDTLGVTQFTPEGSSP